VILRWQLFLTLDQINALLVRLEDERVCSQNDDVIAAIAELEDARNMAAARESGRGIGELLGCEVGPVRALGGHGFGPFTVA
jgi:hypothetical protein